MSFFGNGLPCPRRYRTAGALGIGVTLLAVLTLTTGVDAAHRFIRRFDETSGLTVSTVEALAQDHAGFLWIGTAGGLVRFDGQEFSTWAPGIISGEVEHVVPCPDTGVLAMTLRGDLYRTTDGGAEPVRGPGGVPLTGVSGATYDSSGRLWVIRSHHLWIRAQSWQQPLAEVTGQHAPRYVRALGNSVALLTATDVRLIDRSGKLVRLLPIGGAVDAVASPNGSLVLLEGTGKVLVADLAADRFHEALNLPARGIALVVRGQAVWAAFDRFLARIDPSGASEIMGLAEGIPSGGPLLVDREGSLWMGTFSGLLQFPEPDTAIWTDLEGLPSAHTRFVARSQSGVLVSTWQGLGRVTSTAGTWRATIEPTLSKSRLCRDNSGAVWFGSRSGLYRWSEGKARRVLPWPASVRGCRSGGTGLWLATDSGLLLVRNGAPVAVNVPSGEKGRRPVDAVLETAQGELIWVAGHGICRQPVAAAVAGSPADRTCWEQPNIIQALDLAQVGTEVWLAGQDFGVLRLGRGRAEPPAGVAEFPSRVVFSLTPSARGGVWVAGKGILQRIVACPSCTDEWRVAETLGSWQGLPGRSGGQVLELADGTLWVTTDEGLVRVPPTARSRPAEPQSPVIAETLRNGELWKGPSPLVLDWDARHLELRFAPLSFRDPSQVRFRSRIDHGRWSTATVSSRLSLSSLSSGRHVLEVQASVGGDRWGARPTSLTFRVRPPWYRTWWALLMLAAAIAGAPYLAHRVQMASRARVERERERIARDLHDQVGSGLASIGILATLSGSGAVPPERRTRLAHDIADVSARLSFTLRAIVWSLRGPNADLRDTMAQLADHGAKLLSGTEDGLEVVMPETWPRGGLPLLVRRNLLLIGLEALHNAARHAHASKVQLTVVPSDGQLWRFSVADDGVGFQPADYQDSGVGLGLRNMWRRARAIGGNLDVDSSPGVGTIVTLVFDPWSAQEVAGLRTLRRIT